ncbi:uncharacterized protein [Miscanthus floridulus]|uniref:uncharacterized protein n=1 Tax=Miscanthus floridulus TaxID=154761 RepID=UPI00345AB814
MFLHVVGHNERFRVVDLTFRRSVETISRFFQKVLYVVGELRNELIVPPATNVHPRILGSRRWYPYFKDYIGVIDGTHVLARVPVKMQAAFRGWKHTITQNVLAAMDFDLRFTYVLAGWEGSTHDAFILSDALERADGLRVPPEINNMLDQVVNIGGEDNVVEQGGVVAANDGNPAAPQPNGPMHWTPV